MAQNNGRLRAHRGCAAAIDIHQRAGICIIRCRGSLLAGMQAAYVQGKIQEVKARNCNSVIADFRDVPAIGSAGLALIVGLYTSVAKELGGAFVVAGATPLVRRILEITKLAAVIPLASDYRSAVEALCGEAAPALEAH